MQNILHVIFRLNPLILYIMYEKDNIYVSFSN